ncbi:Stp1/IreP family PP2C-type Ser/Thr phosphatase [bacterium]|nr:Stp1/IreP family PP2C-type Ser/Thr phosphatase [bacterium]
MEIVSAGLTDVGRKRSNNQDHFTCLNDIGLYLVADGMGGHAAGEVASETAVNVISDFVRDALEEEDGAPFPSSTRMDHYQEILVTSVHLANQTISSLSADNPVYEGMGTTLSGMLIRGDQACLVHVGDSRVYRLRGDDLRILTTDHSWVNEQLRRNIITAEEARTHRLRNVITRALGHKMDLEVDSFVEPIESGDVFLICSDGLNSMIEDEEIRRVLAENGEDPRAVCRLLIDRANAAGGDDNVTLVVVRVEKN